MGREEKYSLHRLWCIRYEGAVVNPLITIVGPTLQSKQILPWTWQNSYAEVTYDAGLCL